MDARTLEVVPLYDGPAPGSEDWTHAERAYFSEIFATDVVTNVVVPTLTPVLPADGCGTAVIVAPGGGYHSLSINSEGFDVAHWLAARGVAAFVLKYRLVPSGEDAVAELIEKMSTGGAAADMEAAGRLAGADAAVAVRHVRAHSDDYAIDPGRVGFLGFSAGGNVTLRVAYADDADARPDFVAPIYAAARGLDLTTPPEGSGPMFLVAATDDELGLAADSIAAWESWRAAGLPVELHLYARGGHGFGMRTQGLPSDTWIERFGDWLGATGLLGEPVDEASLMPRFPTTTPAT
ncbi:MAG: alpha/beta hydrolase [Actinomycetota bacterium]|nr:alpha/beta hydrolase [Actinomycetota bacterium]